MNPTWWLLSLAIGAGEPPLVHYVTKAETRSWEPIALAEIEKMIEQAALQPLTAPGSMRLVKTGFGELKQGAYTLVINGRFVEEAELFSVYLTFGPGTQPDLPSFYVAETTKALGRQSRAEMEVRIRAAATAAGKRLAEVLAPRLESVRLQVGAPPMEDPGLPLVWGPVEVPPPDRGMKAVRTLVDVKNDDHQRSAAVAELTGQAFDQPSARDALLHCVLRDPSPRIRVDCVEALTPVARNHLPTQRVLLAAMRLEVADEVVLALVKVSQSFVGLSRLETLATWLELVAADATPSRAAEAIADLLRKEGDVPNLDLAVSACLQQEALAYGKKRSCADTLLKAVPFPRRAAVAYRYLERAELQGTGADQTYEATLEAVIGDRKNATDPRIGALLIEVAGKRSLGRMRYKALYHARDHAPATAATIEKLLAIAHDQRVAEDAVRAIGEVVDRAPELKGMALGGLEQLAKKARWLPKPHRSDPYRELEEVRQRMSRTR